MFTVVDRCPSYGGRDNSCHGHCGQCISELITKTMFARNREPYTPFSLCDSVVDEPQLN